MKRRIFTSLIVALTAVIVLFWLQGHPLQEPRGELRAAMDVGSGSTNLQIARVDVKTGKIITTLFQKSVPVPYQKHLEQSVDNRFDEEVMQQGIAAIKALKESADSYHVKKVIGVATAAFRQADNASEFVQKIETMTGVPVRIINQDEEGILAFRGALALSPVNPQDAVVWDIGGGSMQLTGLTSSGGYIVAKGDTASIPFKNAIIKEIQGKDLKEVTSPNPMSLENIDAALEYAHVLAVKTDAFIQEKIKNPKTEVLAVGSLFNYGVKPLVPGVKIMTQSALEKAVKGLVGKTDTQLPGGPLAEVAVSNPTLVLGYMQGLHIKQVEILQVNNTDGALTHPPYWE